MLELLDEIGREEVRVLREVRDATRMQGAGPSPCSVVWVGSSDLGEQVGNGAPVVRCPVGALSRIEALGLVESLKGQGYEELKGPLFHMQITARGTDLLARKCLVWIASRFTAKTNKWMSFAVAGGVVMVEMVRLVLWVVRCVVGDS